MNRIRDNIPDSVFGLFRKDRANLFLLMDYLCKISSVISESPHYISGITKQACLDVFESVTLDNPYRVGDEEAGLFFEKGVAFNYLAESGWLTMRYDPDCGENLYTISDACKAFIELFKTLNMEPKATSSLKRVYADVNMYIRGPLSGQIEDLREAEKDIISLNQDIAASASFIEKQISELMLLENGKELIEKIFDSMQKASSARYNEETDAGLFRLVMAALRKDVNQELQLVINRLNDEDSDKAEIVSRYANTLDRESKRAMALYDEMLSHKAKICTRALSKYRYLETAGSQESESRLLKLIRIMAKESKQAKRPVSNRAAQVLAFIEMPDLLIDHDVYVPRDKSDTDVQKTLIPEILETPVLDIDAFRPQFSKRELREFEAERTSNGRFRASADNIRSNQDIEMLTSLLLDVMSNEGKSQSIVSGEQIETENGLYFPELSWKV